MTAISEGARRTLPPLIALALFFSATGSASAFCVSGACFSDFRPTSSYSSTSRSSDVTHSAPVPSGPSPEDLRREKERQEREQRLEAARKAHALAMEYARDGDWPRAIEQFGVALDNDPGNEGIDKNLRLARRLQKEEPAVRNIFKEGELDNMQEQARRLLSQGDPGAGRDGASGGGDASVVDLRFVGDRPLIVDPRRLKRGQIPQQPAISSVATMTSAQKERLHFFLQTRREEDTRRTDDRLINPLREPERYTQWLEGEKDRAKDEVSREMTGRILQRMKREQYEKTLDKTLNRFVEAENSGFALSFYQAHLNFQDEMVRLRKRFGMKDYSEVYRQDREGHNRQEVDRLILQDVLEQREKAQEDLEFRRAREEASERVDAKMVRDRDKAHRRAVEELLKSLHGLEKR